MKGRRMIFCGIIAGLMLPACASVPGKANPEAADASACITLDDQKSSVTWDNKNKSVGLNLLYKNTCKRPIKCTVTVTTGTIARDADIKLLKGWKPFKSQYIERDLTPGSQVPITVGIDWLRTKDTLPVVRFPQPPGMDMDYLHCTYTPQNQP